MLPNSFTTLPERSGTATLRFFKDNSLLAFNLKLSFTGLGYEIVFVEIGYESYYVHFLIQSVPSLSLIQIVRTIKSITGREIFRFHPEIKQFLWGGNLWTSGYYETIFGEFGNKDATMKYMENQGKEKEYKKK